MTAEKARAVRFDRYGGREVLYVTDIDRPVPGAGEVLVEVRAAGINPGEAGIRSGALHERFPTTFPSGEGSDLAGVVVAVGDGVSDFSAGDEVLKEFSQRRRRIAAEPFPINQNTRTVQATISIGIAAMRSAEDLPSTIIKRADQALYRAKREGRNRVAADAA